MAMRPCTLLWLYRTHLSVKNAFAFSVVPSHFYVNGFSCLLLFIDEIAA